MRKNRITMVRILKNSLTSGKTNTKTNPGFVKIVSKA
jgi:hypothetical protein